MLASKLLSRIAKGGDSYLSSRDLANESISGDLSGAIRTQTKPFDMSMRGGPVLARAPLHLANVHHGCGKRLILAKPARSKASVPLSPERIHNKRKKNSSSLSEQRQKAWFSLRCFAPGRAAFFFFGVEDAISSGAKPKRE